MKLEGVRVVDLSLFLPGPHLTMMMADHGAEVIKLEPPGGEPSRHFGVREGDTTVWFRNTHRGKKSISLNLKTDEGREALLKLCDTADVFVEAFRPGVVDRLGIGYDVLSERNPGIVYCSLSAFGQDGPMRDKPAHDLAVQAMAGTLSINLGQDGKPALTGVASADATASLMGLAGVLMALLRREKTGKGDYLDVSMLESLMAWTCHVMGPPFGERRAAITKHERNWGGNAFYNIYETKDGRHVALGGSEIKFARNLLEALERPDLVELCELPPGPGQDPVKEFLRQTFATRTLSEWETFLTPIDLCWAPIIDLYQAVCHEHVRERGMVFEDDQGRLNFNNPIRFRNEPAHLDLSIPDIGQHNDEILP